MTRPLCIYHANCVDGFAAAWAVRKFFSQDVDLVARDYKDHAPDVRGRDVIMVDFSYKRPVIDDMAKMARSILILDHHKSARDELQGLIDYPAQGEVVALPILFING